MVWGEWGGFGLSVGHRSQAIAETESCSKLVREVPFRHASCMVAEAPKARVAPLLIRVEGVSPRS